MTEYIKKEDVLKIIYDIKENKDIPKNYGTLIDIIQLVRNIPSEKVISESMGKCELAIAQNNNLYTDCNYCIELAKVEAIKEFWDKLSNRANTIQIDFFHSAYVISEQKADCVLKEMIGEN